MPVALVGDIERGGVIAQLVGTHALLSPAERGRLAGYVVNKFRGDIRLFDGGIAAIGERTGWRCFGVVPFFAEAALLPAEDSMALRPDPVEWDRGRPAPQMRSGRPRSQKVKIAVPLLAAHREFRRSRPAARRAVASNS